MVNVHAKGARAETRVQTWLEVHDLQCARLRLAGVNEQGDLWVPERGKRLEVKNHGNILTALSDGVREAAKLSVRYPNDDCAAVVARPGLAVDEWYYVQQMRWAFRLHPLS